MSETIVVLTGAGISAESGLKTFRAQDGLWENHRIEDVASIDGFLRNPELVQRFYNARRTQLGDPAVQPNAGHVALARLEERWPGEFLLVTQNVDNLHERAGSKKLLHMHGELAKVRCRFSEEVFEWLEPIEAETQCPCCGKAGALRPHIVWFGEMPFHLEEIFAALERCALFVAIGTSGQVYPAAGFVHHVRRSARTVEINPDGTAISSAFGEARRGPASTAVPVLVDEILSRL